MVGRPRPDLLSRCHVDTARAQAAITSTAITLFNSTICTSTDTSTLNDGFRSFPSGIISAFRILYVSELCPQVIQASHLPV